jgi:hypothetical protein
MVYPPDTKVVLVVGRIGCIRTYIDTIVSYDEQDRYST